MWGVWSPSEMRFERTDFQCFLFSKNRKSYMFKLADYLGLICDNAVPLIYPGLRLTVCIKRSTRLIALLAMKFDWRRDYVYIIFSGKHYYSLSQFGIL